MGLKDTTWAFIGGCGSAFALGVMFALFLVGRKVRHWTRILHGFAYCRHHHPDHQNEQDGMLGTLLDEMSRASAYDPNNP